MWPKLSKYSNFPLPNILDIRGINEMAILCWINSLTETQTWQGYEVKLTLFLKIYNTINILYNEKQFKSKTAANSIINQKNKTRAKFQGVGKQKNIHVYITCTKW